MAIGEISSISRFVDVVSRHHHLGSRRKRCHTRHVRCPEVELRAIAGEERRMSSTFFFLQDVDLCIKLLVRRDGSRLRHDHAAFQLFLSTPRSSRPALSPA